MGKDEHHSFHERNVTANASKLKYIICEFDNTVVIYYNGPIEDEIIMNFLLR